MKKNLSTLKSNQMNNLLSHYPVNWIDGMKLSSSHFTAVQDFVTDSVRDARETEEGKINAFSIRLRN